MRKLLFKLIATYIYYTPPHPCRGLLGKLAYRFYPQEFVTEIESGVKMKIRLDNPDDIMIWSWNRGYSDGSEKVFASILQEGMFVFDIGANVGFYTLLAASRIGCKGRVYAFEPIPSIFERLKENIALNDMHNIIPIPVAISDRTGIARMAVAGMASSLFYRAIHASGFIDVTTETLDKFVECEGIKRLDVIKIDVEGAELKVIYGSDQTIRRFKPIMMIEINPPALKSAGATPEEVFSVIISYGYDAYVVRNGKPVPTTKPIKPRWRGFRTLFDDYLFIPR
ncbi:MAG: FkbM family methyltransferase [Armatimonadota bacterium]|nr:FkbM family methyltransferase [Armatimonadota bacterium]